MSHQVAEHASYSSLSSYLQCGLKYKLTKIDGFAEQPAWWSAAGSAVHTATEWWDVGLHEELDVPGLFMRSFEEQILKEETYTGVLRGEWRNSRGQDYDWWVSNGPPMVQSYIDWRQSTGWQVLDVTRPTDGVTQPGVEVPVDAVMGGMPVKGYIDRVFVTGAGEVVIVDLKTGARKPDSALQLGFYRAALQLQYGITADLGAYFMNRRKPGEQLLVEGLQQYTPEFIGRFISDFKRARELKLYIPHVTAMCKACGVARHCWAVGGGK